MFLASPLINFAKVIKNIFFFKTRNLEIRNNIFFLDNMVLSSEKYLSGTYCLYNTLSEWMENK